MRKELVQAQVYILTPSEPAPDGGTGYVITGSSNFSHSGLEGNLEFNVLLREPEGHDYALHRFKGDSTQRYEHLTRICQGKGVILVSATPYNNTLDDIYSQLKLFQPPRNSTIPRLRNLEAFFDKLRNRLKPFHRLDDAEQYVAAVEENAHELRERVLKYVMVRRTRREIEEFYGDDLRKQKIWFPKVSDPVPLLYQLSRAESTVFTDTLECITSTDFHYARYQPLHPEYDNGPTSKSRRTIFSTASIPRKRPRAGRRSKRAS